MQYQNKLKSDPSLQAGQTDYNMQMQLKNQNSDFALGDGMKQNQYFGQTPEEGDMLLNPMDINEPIEGILISEEEKRIAPILQITILEGMQQMIGHKLVINAQGLVASQRNKKDGCTIIGSQEKNMQTGEHYNDFVISNEPLTQNKN